MSLVIAVTGQILVHEPIDTSASPVRAFLAADAVLANLEATVDTPDTWPTKTKTLHLATPAAVSALAAYGFTALGHANNHAFDLGPPGIVTTRDTVNAAGLGFTGSGETLAEAAAPVILPTGGGTVAFFAVDFGPQPEIVYAAPDRAGIAPLRMKRAVAVPPDDFATLKRLVAGLGDDRREAARAAVGYRAGGPSEGAFELFGTEIRRGPVIEPQWSADPADLARLAEAIAAADRQGQTVVVVFHSHHWDPDWHRTPAFIRDLAHALIDAGADLIVGTGAPVLQGMSFYKGRPILGGLGNFVFHTRRPGTYDEKGVDVWRSIAARVTFGAGGACSGVEIMPVAVARPPVDNGPAPAPAPLTGIGADEIFARVVAELAPDERALVRQA